MRRIGVLVLLFTGAVASPALAQAKVKPVAKMKMSASVTRTYGSEIGLQRDLLSRIERAAKERTSGPYKIADHVTVKLHKVDLGDVAAAYNHTMTVTAKVKYYNELPASQALGKK